MSEMSSLSHEYASTSDFSRELNDAVLLLKRDFVRGESGKSKPEIDKAHSAAEKRSRASFGAIGGNSCRTACRE